MNNKLDKIIERFGDFTNGYRLLMLTHRSKDGVSDKDRKVIKRISTNSDDFKKLLNELLIIKHESHLPYRIYSSVNSRNIKKAIRIFKQNQLNADYDNEENRNHFYSDIKNRWISALMQPQSKAESNFLIDIDEGDNLKEAITVLSTITRNVFKYKTKNGHHLITEPFNPERMNGWEIKKDGLILLDY